MHRSRRRYGGVFTIRLVNQYLTVIMDPHNYEAFCRTRTLDFDRIQKQVNWNVFNFRLVDAKTMIKATGKTVVGLNLVRALRDFAANLTTTCDEVTGAPMKPTKDGDDATRASAGGSESKSVEATWGGDGNTATSVVIDGNLVVAKRQEEEEEETTATKPFLESNWKKNHDDDWKSEGLRVLVARTMFAAIFRTIFGGNARLEAEDPRFSAASTFRSFEVFHRYFNYFWLGFPKRLFPPAVDALHDLRAMPDSGELLERDDLSPYIRTAVEYMLRQGQTESDIKGHNLVYLHVNYNTFRLAFWSLNGLLEHGEAYATLQREVDGFVEEHLDVDDNVVAFSLDDIAALKILGEFFSSLISIRQVALIISTHNVSQ